MTSLMVVGLLGLLVAGFFFVNMPIIKWSGPNAYEAIEEHYVDPGRVNHDADSLEQYEFYKSWVMGNEPTLRSTLRHTRTLGIVFSLLVSFFAFGLACYISHGARPSKPRQPASGTMAGGQTPQ